MTQDRNTCSYCRYYGRDPYTRDIHTYWCFRWNIPLITSDTEKCEKFKLREGHSKFVNAPLLGLKEREKDRIKEKTKFLVLSGALGIIGAIFGVIVGYLLR